MELLDEITAANEIAKARGFYIQQRSNGKFAVSTRTAEGLFAVKGAGKFETVADALAFVVAQ